MRQSIALVAARDALDLDTDGPFLFPALEDASVAYEVVAWDDPSVRWNRFGAVVLRATWDYYQRPDDFIDVIEAIAAVATLYNPIEPIQWNIDKRYLSELSRAGHPTVPTAFVAHLSPPTELGAALSRLERWECEEVVVKPTVSAGSNDTFRLDAPDGSAITRAVQAIIDGDRVAMLQPYLSLVDSYGERGCVYVNGTFDHAFAKAALLSPGGPNIDGLFAPENITSTELTDEERSVADGVNRWLTDRFGPLLFARIDLLPSRDGPMIVEVELIEPSLFFEADPPSAARFAAVLAEIV
ncbi:MAG: hypothetical protein HKN24_01915 [Acidimicrobiales bacterium]|nr:hypothetical protein [Acidimicrobiales bacterium]